MLEFAKKYLGPLIVSRAKAAARHLACSSGVVILAWLVQHHVGQDDAVRLVGDYKDVIDCVVGIGLTWAGFGASQRNVTHNDAKVTAAAAAGVSNGVALAHARQDGADAQAQADQSVADAVKSAIDTAGKAKATDKAAILSSLKDGSF